jgi:hypothetical protein
MGDLFSRQAVVERILKDGRTPPEFAPDRPALRKRHRIAGAPETDDGGRQEEHASEADDEPVDPMPRSGLSDPDDEIEVDASAVEEEEEEETGALRFKRSRPREEADKAGSSRDTPPAKKTKGTTRLRLRAPTVEG